MKIIGGGVERQLWGEEKRSRYNGQYEQAIAEEQ